MLVKLPGDLGERLSRRRRLDVDLVVDLELDLDRGMRCITAAKSTSMCSGG